MLAMEAAEKSVQSPIVLPSDVNELQLGGDAIIRTANPAGVRRVELTLPQGAFTEQTILNQELRVGSRYPESRTGNIDASIVTGQGVQALMGAFDTQIKSAQAIFASALREVISICFEVDEKVFPGSKTIRGVDSGSPYEITYEPSKDIKGDYSADVRYGMLAGSATRRRMGRRAPSPGSTTGSGWQPSCDSLHGPREEDRGVSAGRDDCPQLLALWDLDGEVCVVVDLEAVGGGDVWAADE